jgi:hypothetical protein
MSGTSIKEDLFRYFIEFKQNNPKKWKRTRNIGKVINHGRRTDEWVSAFGRAGILERKKGAYRVTDDYYKMLKKDPVSALIVFFDSKRKVKKK